MKMTQLLIITLFISTVFGCSKQDATDNQAESMPAVMDSSDAMPSVTTEKPKKMLPNEISADDTTTEIEQDDSGKKVLYWQDPMVEGRRFSKSGQSPFMDMQLVPHYVEEKAQGAKP